MNMKMRFLLPMAALFAIAMTCGFTGCSSNPVETASQATPDNKPETIAFAVFGSYVVIEELAADIKDNPTTPQAVKDGLKRASLATAPAAESLRDAATTVRDLRKVISQGRDCGTVSVSPGRSTQKCLADLPALLGNVNQLLTDTAPKITKFTEAYANAKRGVATP